MFVNATGLNVNHHKKVSSNMSGSKAEKEKKVSIQVPIRIRRTWSIPGFTRARLIELSFQSRE